MADRLRSDAFGFELPDGPRGYLRIAIHTILINETIALPLALVKAAGELDFGTSLIILSVYAQSIGALCATSSIFAFGWLERLTPVRGLLGLMTLYFVCGVAGAETARRICGWIYGPEFDPGAPYMSWAIGAIVSLIVGVVLRTVRRLRARVVSTELEALQARINPHFLFNTLNSIAALIREDPARAEAMTLRLSSLFRYTLTASKLGLVTLEEELAIVEGYLGIEQERLGTRLKYEIHVEPTLRRYRLPALTLQPLVENAIKHGIAAAVEGGSIAIRGWRQNELVHISVTDTGGAAEANVGGTGEGLDSVRRRLTATFGARSSMTLTAIGGGTKAQVTFPVVESPS